MAKVNVTQLRQNLPEYLARVRAGDSVEVTVRGKVIARIVPEQDRAAAARTRLKALRGKTRVGDVMSPSGERWRTPSVVVVDTHVLIHDALEPRKLSVRARRVLEGERGPLAISDISLWEIGMLVAKGRVDPGVDAVQFIEDIVDARSLRILAITPGIAVLAQSDAFAHGDPADRIIAATAVAHRAPLLTADSALRKIGTIETLW